MKNILCLMLLTLTTLGCTQDSFTEKLPNKSINVNLYMGKWYEIARLPNWFEKNMINVTATYSLKDNGKIKVLNQGTLNTPSKEKKEAIGEAWLPNSQNTGRLKVSFFWPFAADYIILETDAEHTYALVGATKDYLWILSRTPQLNPDIYNQLVNKAKELGFDVSKLEQIEQQENTLNNNK